VRPGVHRGVISRQILSPSRRTSLGGRFSGHSRMSPTSARNSFTSTSRAVAAWEDDEDSSDDESDAFAFSRNLDARVVMGGRRSAYGMRSTDSRLHPFAATSYGGGASRSPTGSYARSFGVGPQRSTVPARVGGTERFASTRQYYGSSGN
jgi:hypothetical protein